MYIVHQILVFSQNISTRDKKIAFFSKMLSYDMKKFQKTKKFFIKFADEGKYLYIPKICLSVVKS